MLSKKAEYTMSIYISQSLMKQNIEKPSKGHPLRNFPLEFNGENKNSLCHILSTIRMVS